MDVWVEGHHIREVHGPIRQLTSGDSEDCGNATWPQTEERREAAGLVVAHDRTGPGPDQGESTTVSRGGTAS